MRNLLFASTAVVLLSGSLAFADNPRIANDNDHMEALSFAIEQTAQLQARQGAQVFVSLSQGGVVTGTASAGRVSLGFLLHTSDNDHKQIENQYAR